MGTHYVTHELLAVGHDVRQVPPVYAKPFRQTHKNDFRDAHAIAETVRRPTTQCVPAKTDEQLDLQALHRVRYRLVGQRTAVINRHLMTIPGIGPIISSAVVAAIGNGTAFTRGRDFAAWLGLVPIPLRHRRSSGQASERWLRRDDCS
jgi:transposase